MVAIKNPNRKAADAFGEILNAISTWLFGIVPKYLFANARKQKSR